MAALYRPDVVVTRTALNQSDIDALNEALPEEGITQPLGSLRVGNSKSTVVSTTADAADVRNAVRRLRARGRQVPSVDLDYRYVPGTLSASTREGNFDFYATGGCRTGHAATPWLPAPDYAMPKGQPWEKPAGGARRPVVALLDTEVKAHKWFPAQDESDPFFFAPWRSKERLPEIDDGKFAGHGVFNAGLIRVGAPDARVLSMPVMSDDGHVDESRLIEALEWLAGREEHVDVVCMPFGRPRHDADDTMQDVKEALSNLPAGVTVVASAGNDDLDEPNYPAAFAVETDLSTAVVSVGSSESPTRRAPYSNYGVWVKQWRGGSNVVSCLPIPKTLQALAFDGYVWWKGTSFAAVIYAAELLAKLGK